MNRPSSYVLMIAALVMLSLTCVLIGATLARTGVAGGGYTVQHNELALLDQIWGAVDRDFYQPIEDSDVPLEAAVKAFVAALGDDYTHYMGPEESATLLEETKGEYGGVGMTLMQSRGFVKVFSVFEGTPADNAGIQPGDLITHAGEDELYKVPLSLAVSKIKGMPDTEVKLTVLRPETGKSFDVNLMRAIIQIPNISKSEMLAGGIGYVKLDTFNEQAAEDFRQSVEMLKSEGMKGLILDLRGNAGGLLEAAVTISSLLLPEGTIVSIEDRDGISETFGDQLSASLDLPLVVLVDEYSASASEIVSGAIKDNGAGILVGETTFGKGLVQGVYTIGEPEMPSVLVLTIKRYLTPSGAYIHNTGIEPDVYITDAIDKTEDPHLKELMARIEEKNEQIRAIGDEITDLIQDARDYLTTHDVQLDKAQEVIGEYLATGSYTPVPVPVEEPETDSPESGE